ncbi:hypothetical protein COR50_16210 [Chitinophaga caeni]|uniref:Peptidyl-prolyl cis-trans isomerase n=1 Tax=Chitinophaga caeni TaxID=2029983 RepID=A0A291QXD7_9BACT|nr:FKBP-type peptidyl-prolyl cis-trans isomerase [Chitinophaga caeni]ATL48581.1 hypothetical protein COR50_16210 [Chitinophaga caeni]
MKKSHLFLAAAAFGVMAASCGQKKGKTSGGFEYTILKAGNGDQLKVGDTALMYVRQTLNDSLLIDSRDQSPNAIPVPIVKSMDKFDLMDGIANLRVGDSACFSVPVDSLPQVPFFAKKGDFINLTFVVDGKYSSATQNEKDAKIIKDYISEKKLNAVELGDGVYAVINEEGSGELPADGDTLSMYYTGKLLDGKIFDTNQDTTFRPGMPLTAFKFKLGEGRVIKGWDVAMAKLKKGAKATILIPSALGYGFRGSQPNIPPNAVLAFDVEVSDIIKSTDTAKK